MPTPHLKTASKPRERDFKPHSHLGLTGRYALLLKKIYLRFFKASQAGRIARAARDIRVLSNIAIITGAIWGTLLHTTAQTGLMGGLKLFVAHKMALGMISTSLIFLGSFSVFGLAILFLARKQQNTSMKHWLALGLLLGGLALSASFLFPASIFFLPKALIAWGVCTHTFAWLAGASANNEKIEPRYLMLAELHDRLNTLREEMGKPKHRLLHGVKEYRQYSPELWKMTKARRLHDANSTIGTVLTGLISVSLMGGLGMGIGFGALVLACMFVASRLSGGASAGFAYKTNTLRLETYNEILNAQQNEHLSLLKEKHPENHLKITALIERVFNAQGFNENFKYRSRLYYRFFMATFDYCQIKGFDNQDALEQKLKALLCKCNSRENLMSIGDGDTRAVLTNMQFIENEVFAKLYLSSEKNTSTKDCEKITKDVLANWSGTNKALLASQLRRALLQYKAKNNNPTLDETATTEKVNAIFSTTPRTLAKNLGGEPGLHSDGFTDFHYRKLFVPMYQAIENANAVVCAVAQDKTTTQSSRALGMSI